MIYYGIRVSTAAIYMYIYCKWMVLYHRTLDGLHKTQSPTRSTNSRKVLEDPSTKTRSVSCLMMKKQLLKRMTRRSPFPTRTSPHLHLFKLIVASIHHSQVYVAQDAIFFLSFQSALQTCEPVTAQASRCTLQYKL